MINLAQGKIKLIISSTKTDNLGLQITDMAGNEILQNDFGVVTGNNSKELVLQKGAYVVTLANSAGERIANKIIVQ